MSQAWNTSFRFTCYSETPCAESRLQPRGSDASSQESTRVGLTPALVPTAHTARAVRSVCRTLLRSVISRRHDGRALPNPGRPPGPHPGPGSCFTWTWPLRGSGDGSRSRGPAPCRRPQGRACSWKPASARQPAAAVWAVGWLSSKRESLKGRAGV